MDSALITALERVEDAVRICFSAHERRAEDYIGLTLSERAGLVLLADEIAALEREEAFPLRETAA
jgi:hypothetical protein